MREEEEVDGKARQGICYSGVSSNLFVKLVEVPSQFHYSQSQTKQTILWLLSKLSA